MYCVCCDLSAMSRLILHFRLFILFFKLLYTRLWWIKIIIRFRDRAQRRRNENVVILTAIRFPRSIADVALLLWKQHKRYRWSRQLKALSLRRLSRLSSAVGLITATHFCTELQTVKRRLSPFRIRPHRPTTHHWWLAHDVRSTSHQFCSRSTGYRSGNRFCPSWRL